MYEKNRSNLTAVFHPDALPLLREALPRLLLWTLQNVPDAWVGRDQIWMVRIRFELVAQAMNISSQVVNIVAIFETPHCC